VEKAALTDQLAAMPADSQNQSTAVTERLAAYLSDVAGAWKAATPVERNKLARELFNGVVIENRTAVAVMPRPDLRAFFETLAVAPSSVVTYGRKRRGSVSSPRYAHRCTEPLCFAPVPPRGVAGQSRRAPCHLPKRRKLSAEQEESIRAGASNRTLRELAAEYGVSHETIRTVLRQTGSA
nr:hypothetical protein [Actinomycetota bacterium]